jgi:hypothetical protein
MNLDDLNSETFLLYAAKNYDTKHCVLSEFEQDLKRFKYLKRLFRRYKLTGEIKERLVLNHIIILSNIFGGSNSSRMLFYKIDKRDYDVLKTFLVFLNLMPDILYRIDGKNIISSDIQIDPVVTDKLRKIYASSTSS